MRRILTVLLALMLMPLAVFADETLEVSLDQTGEVTASSGYIRVIADLQEAGPVVLSVYDPGESLVYQRAWTAQAGRLESDSIYLPLTGTETRYTVRLQCQNSLRSRVVRRVPPRLTGCRASSCGCPLSAISGAGGQASATILDLTSLAWAPVTVALHAGGVYMIGTVTFRLEGNELLVTTQTIPGRDITIDAAEVQLALTCEEARQLGRRDYAGVRSLPGEPLDVTGAVYAAVYLQLTVSFSPDGLPLLTDSELAGQRYLWSQMADEGRAEFPYGTR